MGAGPRTSLGVILLVENEYALRELMRRFLEGAGFAVIGARDGDEALALASSHPTPVDLLLTDVVMPGLSGFALAAKVLELRAETKVLYISGYAAEYDMIREGLNDSGKPFLLKPFAQTDLIRKIEEVLHGQSASSPTTLESPLARVLAGRN